MQVRVLPRAPFLRLWCNWLTRLPSKQKICGFDPRQPLSFPDGVIGSTPDFGSGGRFFGFESSSGSSRIRSSVG